MNAIRSRAGFSGSDEDHWQDRYQQLLNPSKLLHHRLPELLRPHRPAQIPGLYTSRKDALDRLLHPHRPGSIPGCEVEKIAVEGMTMEKEILITAIFVVQPFAEGEIEKIPRVRSTE